MPTEENKAIVRREVEELYNPDGDLDAVEEIFAPDYVLHDPSLPEEGRGPEAARQLATAFRSAFPDLHTTFDEAVAEGDKVAYRWTASGTHEGELMGISHRQQDEDNGHRHRPFLRRQDRGRVAELRRDGA